MCKIKQSIMLNFSKKLNQYYDDIITINDNINNIRQFHLNCTQNDTIYNNNVNIIELNIALNLNMVFIKVGSKRCQSK